MNNITIKPIVSGSTGNCYYISDGKTNILIECGISFKKIQQAVGFKVSKLSGVLISHEHKDHSHSAKDMIKAGINCYMSPGTAKVLKLSGYRVKTVSAMEQFKIGTWEILPFDTIHDSEELPCKEPLGFLLVSGKNKIFYSGDTAYLRYRFKGLTHIMIETNYQDELLQQNIEEGIVDYGLKRRLLQTHMSLKQVIVFLKVNDLKSVQEIYLLHLSSRNANAEEMQDAVIKETGKPVMVL